MEDNNKYTDDTSSFGTSENQDTYSSPETEQPDSHIKAMPVDDQPYQQNYSAGQQSYQQNYGYTQPDYNNGQPDYNAGQQYSQQPYGTQVPPVQPYAQTAYGQAVYGSQPNGARQKNEGIGFGIASMVLGILSILLFCTCFNIITAILAVIFGIIQLVKCKNKVFAIVGISTAAASIILTIIFWIVVAPNISTNYYNTFRSEYPDLYEEFYNDTY